MRFEEGIWKLYSRQPANLFPYNLSPTPPPFIRQYFYGFRASFLLRTKADVGFCYSKHFCKPVTKPKLSSLKKRVYKPLAVNQSQCFR